MRIWFKECKNSHMIKDMVICNEDDDTRTHKIFNALTVICDKWDLSKPIWLNANIEEFKSLAKTRFYADNFIDQIDFDYLEMHVIEE
jgi:hypothetical protein